MLRLKLILVFFLLSASPLLAQSLEKPSVPAPSIKKVKTVHSSGDKAGYMGLFDCNFGAGYISKTTHETFRGYSPRNLNSEGQYANFRLQEGVLSNYFLAKKYNRDKRVKFGFQETLDLGVKWGEAANTQSNHTTDTLNKNTDKVGGYFGYQAAGAVVVRVSPSFDLGFTWYPYVKSALCPGVTSYSKLRARLGHFMAEYSFGGRTAVELKYVRNRKLYVGGSYSKYEQNFTNGYSGNANVNTNFYQVSIGRVF